MLITEVIVDLALNSVDKIYDYIIDTLDVEIGSRVKVPFGKTFKEGFVVGIALLVDLSL